MKKFFSPEPAIITTGGGGAGLFNDTIRNMQNAVSLGSDVIRTNVAITKDHKIVLFSNTVFQNKELAERGVGSHSLKELKALYCAGAAGINADAQADDDMKGLFPDMEETLSALKQQRFNLHIAEKDPGLLRKFCDSIHNLNAEDRILVSSLNGYNIKKIRGIFPEIPTGFSFGSVVAFYGLYRSGLIYFKRKFRDDVLIIHEMIGASFLANAGLIEEAKARGIRVYVLNVMKEDQVRRLSEAGVDGYVTNYVSLVKRSLPISGGMHDS